MVNKYNCIGCGKPIPENLITQRSKPDATEWLKSGYCSMKCFKNYNIRFSNDTKTELIKCPFCGKENLENADKCSCGYYFNHEVYIKVAKEREVTEKILEKEKNADRFFEPEKKGVKAGVLGGIIMMSIAVVWFFVGLKSGWVFFYPPILFCIGLFAFIKGLFTGNISGEKNIE